MKINHVTTVIRQTITKKGIVFEERNSVSTSSVYFKIYSSSRKESLLFRIADHYTKADVITLRIDHKSTEKSVENFVINRINDLRKRSLKNILGM